MIIKKIIIDNIQSIEHLELELDEKVTRIAGANASGKSAIVKSLELFAGNYTRNEVKALIRDTITNTIPPRVSLLLEDNTVMTAIISPTNSSVQYFHSDLKGNTLNKWNNHNKEILDILSWKTIEDEMCLNIKESHMHLFVNTKGKTNGILVDYLCRNEDLELKIAKLEEKTEDIKAISKEADNEISIKMAERSSYPNFELIDMQRVYTQMNRARIDIATVETFKLFVKTQNLENQKSDLEEIKKLQLTILGLTKLNQIIQTKETKKQLKELQSSRIKLQTYLGINKSYSELKIKKELEDYLKLKDEIRTIRGNKLINDNITLKNNLNNTKSQIEQMRNLQNQINNEINNTKYLNTRLKYIKERNDLSNLMKSKVLIDKSGSVKYLNQSLDIQKERKALERLQILRDLSNKRIQTNKVINSGIKLLLEKDKIENYKELQNKLQESYNKLQFITNYKDKINKYREEMKESDEILKCLTDYLEENNICPTCHQEIDASKYKEHVGGESRGY